MFAALKHKVVSYEGKSASRNNVAEVQRVKKMIPQMFVNLYEKSKAKYFLLSKHGRCVSVVLILTLLLAPATLVAATAPDVFPEGMAVFFRTPPPPPPPANSWGA